LAPNQNLANLDVESAIERIASGTLTRTIAAEYGVPKPTLRDRLKNHPKYKDALIEQAESIVEKATAEMMDDDLPADVSVIARARARVDTAHKWAAARDPERWAGKGVQINIGAVLNLDPASVSSIGGLLERAASQQAEEKIIDSSDPKS